MHVASRIVPAANRFGGSKQNVATAVDQIEREGSAEAFLERLASVAAVTTRPRFGVTIAAAPPATFPALEQRLEYGHLRDEHRATSRARDGAA